MGIFSAIGEAIANAFMTAAKVVESGVSAAAHAIESAVSHVFGSGGGGSPHHERHQETSSGGSSTSVQWITPESQSTPSPVGLAPVPPYICPAHPEATPRQSTTTTYQTTPPPDVYMAEHHPSYEKTVKKATRQQEKHAHHHTHHHETTGSPIGLAPVPPAQPLICPAHSNTTPTLVLTPSSTPTTSSGGSGGGGSPHHERHQASQRPRHREGQAPETPYSPRHKSRPSGSPRPRPSPSQSPETSPISLVTTPISYLIGALVGAVTGSREVAEGVAEMTEEALNVAAKKMLGESTTQKPQHRRETVQKPAPSYGAGSPSTSAPSPLRKPVTEPSPREVDSLVNEALTLKTKLLQMANTLDKLGQHTAAEKLRSLAQSLNEETITDLAYLNGVSYVENLLASIKQNANLIYGLALAKARGDVYNIEGPHGENLTLVPILVNNQLTLIVLGKSRGNIIPYIEDYLKNTPQGRQLLHRLITQYGLNPQNTMILIGHFNTTATDIYRYLTNVATYLTQTRHSLSSLRETVNNVFSSANKVLNQLDTAKIRSIINSIENIKTRIEASTGYPILPVRLGPKTFTVYPSIYFLEHPSLLKKVPTLPESTLDEYYNTLYEVHSLLNLYENVEDFLRTHPDLPPDVRNKLIYVAVRTREALREIFGTDNPTLIKKRLQTLYETLNIVSTRNEQEREREHATEELGYQFAKRQNPYILATFGGFTLPTMMVLEWAKNKLWSIPEIRGAWKWITEHTQNIPLIGDIVKYLNKASRALDIMTSSAFQKGVVEYLKKRGLSNIYGGAVAVGKGINLVYGGLSLISSLLRNPEAVPVIGQVLGWLKTTPLKGAVEAGEHTMHSWYETFFGKPWQKGEEALSTAEKPVGGWGPLIETISGALVMLPDIAAAGLRGAAAAAAEAGEFGKAIVLSKLAKAFESVGEVTTKLEPLSALLDLTLTKVGESVGEHLTPLILRLARRGGRLGSILDKLFAFEYEVPEEYIIKKTKIPNIYKVKLKTAPMYLPLSWLDLIEHPEIELPRLTIVRTEEGNLKILPTAYTPETTTVEVEGTELTPGKYKVVATVEEPEKGKLLIRPGRETIELHERGYRELVTKRRKLLPYPRTETQPRYITVPVKIHEEGKEYTVSPPLTTSESPTVRKTPIGKGLLSPAGKTITEKTLTWTQLEDLLVKLLLQSEIGGIPEIEATILHGVGGVKLPVETPTLLTVTGKRSTFQILATPEGLFLKTKIEGYPETTYVKLPGEEPITVKPLGEPPRLPNPEEELDLEQILDFVKNKLLKTIKEEKPTPIKIEPEKTRRLKIEPARAPRAKTREVEIPVEGENTEANIPVEVTKTKTTMQTATLAPSKTLQEALRVKKLDDVVAYILGRIEERFPGIRNTTFETALRTFITKLIESAPSRFLEHTTLNDLVAELEKMLISINEVKSVSLPFPFAASLIMATLQATLRDMGIAVSDDLLEWLVRTSFKVNLEPTPTEHIVPVEGENTEASIPVEVVKAGEGAGGRSVRTESTLLDLTIEKAKSRIGSENLVKEVLERLSERYPQLFRDRYVSELLRQYVKELISGMYLDDQRTMTVGKLIEELSDLLETVLELKMKEPNPDLIYSVFDYFARKFGVKPERGMLEEMTIDILRGGRRIEKTVRVHAEETKSGTAPEAPETEKSITVTASQPVELKTTIAAARTRYPPDDLVEAVLSRVEDVFPDIKKPYIRELAREYILTLLEAMPTREAESMTLEDLVHDLVDVFESIKAGRQEIKDIDVLRRFIYSVLDRLAKRLGVKADIYERELARLLTSEELEETIREAEEAEKRGRQFIVRIEQRRETSTTERGTEAGSGRGEATVLLQKAETEVKEKTKAVTETKEEVKPKTETKAESKSETIASMLSRGMSIDNVVDTLFFDMEPEVPELRDIGFKSTLRAYLEKLLEEAPRERLEELTLDDLKDIVRRIVNETRRAIAEERGKPMWDIAASMKVRKVLRDIYREVTGREPAEGRFDDVALALVREEEETPLKYVAVTEDVKERLQQLRRRLLQIYETEGLEQLVRQLYDLGIGELLDIAAALKEEALTEQDVERLLELYVTLRLTREAVTPRQLIRLVDLVLLLVPRTIQIQKQELKTETATTTTTIKPITLNITKFVPNFVPFSTGEIKLERHREKKIELSPRPPPLLPWINAFINWLTSSGYGTRMYGRAVREVLLL